MVLFSDWSGFNKLRRCVHGVAESVVCVCG